MNCWGEICGCCCCCDELVVEMVEDEAVIIDLSVVATMSASSLSLLPSSDDIKDVISVALDLGE